MGNRGSRPTRPPRRLPGGGGIGGGLGRVFLEELLREVIRTVIDNNRDNKHDNEPHFLKRSELRAAMQAPGSDITWKSNEDLRQLGISEDKLEQLAIKHGYTVKE